MSFDQSYLEKINEDDNAIKNAFKLDKKIILRIIYFVICSILYLLIALIGKKSGLHDIKTLFITDFVKYIMYLTFGISIGGIVFIIAYLNSKKIKEMCVKSPYKKKNTLFALLDWILILPACAVTVSFCFAFIFTLSTVDGQSMMPTIKDEATVFVSYNNKVERYDVVVCYVNSVDNIINNYSDNYESYYIKRVIGLPGDEITYSKNGLMINGIYVDEYYFSDETKLNIINNFKSDSNSVNRFIMQGIFRYKEDGEIKQTYVIPEGYYFVMGDNRNNSNDSREIGLIPFKNIEGVVTHQINGLNIKKLK